MIQFSISWIETALAADAILLLWSSQISYI